MITEWAVKRWQLTLVACVLLATLGFSALFAIPKSVDPQFPIEIAVVTATLPGADAIQVEETLTRPIETALQALDHVRYIRSTSTNAVSVVTVVFVAGSDVEQTLDRTVREINSIRSRLPPDLGSLDFRRIRTSEAAVLQLALISADASSRRMEKYATDLRDALNVVPGVRNVKLNGVVSPQVMIEVDQAKLAALRMPVTAVADAVRNGGLDVLVGAVRSDALRIDVNAGGAYRSLADIRSVPLRQAGSDSVQVGDVADVRWGEAERLHITRFNGKRAIFLAVQQKDDVNALELSDALALKSAELGTTLPPDMQLVSGFDQSQDIEQRFKGLAVDFCIATLLVAITLLPLGSRASLVVMLAMPLSLSMGVLALYLLGYTLNQISISGFILSLGLLVDDSIVVTENIERHLRMGKSRIAAAIDGTREVAGAVAGATGVLLFAFLPLANLSEGSGGFVRGLPLAVFMTVGSSLLVALTAVAFFASRLLKPSQNAQGNWLLQAITAGIEGFYRPFLKRSLDYPKTTLGLALALCLSAFSAIPAIGFSLFPAADLPYFIVQVETPEGTTLAATDRAVRTVSDLISREPEIADRMENVGRGNPQIFYNYLQREFNTNYGEIFVTMKHWDAVDGPRFIERLRAKLAAVQGARVAVLRFANGPLIDAPIAIRVRGDDLTILAQLSQQIVQILNQVDGTRDINNPLSKNRKSLDLNVDKELANSYGVSPAAVRQTLRIALSGERASLLRDSEGDNYPVTVRFPVDFEQPASFMNTILIPTQNNTIVPLLTFASPRLAEQPTKIDRYELQRYTTVTAYAQTGFLASDINTAMQDKLEGLRLPAGYSIEVAGEAEAQSRSSSGIGPVILLCIFGIVAVLVLEFGRFREVLVVIGIIPLGFVGGIFALLISGYSLSFLAVIGFVALIGIEIKNSILLVDFTAQLRRAGLPLREAIEQAGAVRMLPVLLTSVTAIGGLLPLALSGSSLYAPLAWVIIGGLISSTILSRIVIPSMYYIVVRGVSNDAG